MMDVDEMGCDIDDACLEMDGLDLGDGDGDIEMNEKGKGKGKVKPEKMEVDDDDEEDEDVVITGMSQVSCMRKCEFSSGASPCDCARLPEAFPGPHTAVFPFLLFSIPLRDPRSRLGPFF